MSKKVLFVFLIILITMGYIFKLDKLLLEKLNNFTFSIKSSYISVINKTRTSFDKYLNQEETIQRLQTKLQDNNNYKILYNTIKQELGQIKSQINMDNIDFDLKYVRVLSYVNLGDFSKVILDTKATKNIRALISSDGYSAGIVFEENNKAVAYLNPHNKANYAVFIGDSNSTGITTGQDKGGNIIVKYIPKYKVININDEVSTSGMDNIFPLGIKVGKVIKITELPDTKEILVKPYKDILAQKYFYIIEPLSPKLN